MRRLWLRMGGIHDPESKDGSGLPVIVCVQCGRYIRDIHGKVIVDARIPYCSHWCLLHGDNNRKGKRPPEEELPWSPKRAQTGEGVKRSHGHDLRTD